jgi:hypothetical protein
VECRVSRVLFQGFLLLLLPLVGAHPGPGAFARSCHANIAQSHGDSINGTESYVAPIVCIDYDSSGVATAVWGRCSCGLERKAGTDLRLYSSSTLHMACIVQRPSLDPKDARFGEAMAWAATKRVSAATTAADPGSY